MLLVGEAVTAVV